MKKELSTQYGYVTLDEDAYAAYQTIVAPLAALTQEQFSSHAYHAIKGAVARGLLREFSKPKYCHRDWIWGNFWGGQSISECLHIAKRYAEQCEAVLIDQLQDG